MVVRYEILQLLGRTIANMQQISKWKILKSSRKSKTHLELIKLITLPIFLLFLVGVSSLLLQLKIYADEVPTREKIAQVLSNKGENSKIYDRNGELLYIFKDPIQDREYAEIWEIPPVVIAAVLAAEDEDFFRHEGIDYVATARGVMTTLTSGGENVVGGSTITQQLVKQTLLTNERTVDRKAKEAIIATMVEEQYDKMEILELYLNVTPYGGRVIGIKTAARTYFNKSLQNLTLNEAAFLVSLIQSPGEYSPLYSNDKEQAIILSDKRRRFVLQQILDNEHLVEYLKSGDLAALDFEAAKEQPSVTIPVSKTYTRAKIAKQIDTEIEFKTRTDFIRAPHFVFYVRDLLAKKPYNLTSEDLYSGGYQIYTTLDLDIQRITQRKLSEGVYNYGPQYGFENGAATVINAQTGEILAMVGSKGYNLQNDKSNKKFDPKVNVAIANQSLGSSLKPWVAYLAFDRANDKYKQYTKVVDESYSFLTPEGWYTPKNADGKFMGEMTIHQALLLSRNIPFLKIADDIGSWQLPELMTQIGYKKQNQYGLAAAIGGVDENLLDHTAAYTGLANGGSVKKHLAVLRILDNEGDVVFKGKKRVELKSLNIGSVAAVNNILGDRGFTAGTYSLKFIGSHKLAGKTGTSDNNRDTYYIGYSPALVVGVWTGNNDNTPMSANAFGSTTALPVWNGIMSEILANRPDYHVYGSY